MPPIPFSDFFQRWKCRIAGNIPVAESIGVLLGILGFDLISEGRADLPKSLLAALIFAAVIVVWRCWRQR